MLQQNNAICIIYTPINIVSAKKTVYIFLSVDMLYIPQHFNFQISLLLLWFSEKFWFKFNRFSIIPAMTLLGIPAEEKTKLN